MFKKIIITLISLFVFAAPALASDLLFASSSIEVEENETFVVVVTLDPKGRDNYTIKLDMEFPADILEIISFDFPSNWLPLLQPGYDLIDNTNGKMIKTAGYPGGTGILPKTFGRVSFRAKSTGTGLIKVGSGSFAFDAENQNVLTFKPEIAVSVIPRPALEFPLPEEPEKEIPLQLFDINMEIDQKQVFDIEELAMRVIFESFGTEPTPVDLTFAIINELGEEVYQAKDYLIVETEAVFTKEFRGLDLPTGKYTLQLTTLYNLDVYDEFEDNFEIIAQEELGTVSIFKTLWFWALVLVVLIVVIIIVAASKTKLNQE